MKRLVYTLALAIVSSFFLIVCGAQPGTSVQASVNAHDEDGLPLATRRELAAAHRATAKYQSMARAMEDGYVDIDAFFPKMGYHFLKSPFLDATFEIEKPELLVYGIVPPSNCLRLVAVEYAVPLDLSPEAPEGFTGDADHWHANTDFGLWTLHAWVFADNPDGVFAEFNPRVR